MQFQLTDRQFSAESVQNCTEGSPAVAMRLVGHILLSVVVLASSSMVDPVTNSMVVPVTDSMVVPVTDSMVDPVTKALVDPVTKASVDPASRSVMPAGCTDFTVGDCRPMGDEVVETWQDIPTPALCQVRPPPHPPLQYLCTLHEYCRYFGHNMASQVRCHTMPLYCE